MMKKQILNIGKALNKAEQKQINGGGGPGDASGECGESSGLSCIASFGWGPSPDCNLNEVCVPFNSETQAGTCQCPS